MKFQNKKAGVVLCKALRCYLQFQQITKKEYTSADFELLRGIEDLVADEKK